VNGSLLIKNLVRAMRERRLLRSVWRAVGGPGTLINFLMHSSLSYVRDYFSSESTVQLSDIRRVKHLVRQESVLSDENLDRLCRSYLLMDQESPKDTESPYFVGGLWEEWKIVHQSKLIRALLNSDYAGLRRLLSFLGIEEASRGISLSGDFARGNTARMFQVNRTNKLLSTYRAIHPYGEIQLYPENWGAFPGALMKNKDGLPGVMIPSGPRLSHNARTLSSMSLAAGALAGEKGKWGPIIEIGGGFGGIAYHIKKETNFSGIYTNIDIPEVLIISAAFLMSVFNSDDIYLHGDSLERKTSSIRLIPHYTMPTVPRDSSSVIFNSHSLTEMNFSTIEEYLMQIERISPAFFLHHNHEYRSEYLVGEKLKRHAVLDEGSLTFENGFFERISRTPEVLTNDGEAYGKLDYWENLYINTNWNQ
jgi:hypothetical protein